MSDPPSGSSSPARDRPTDPSRTPAARPGRQRYEDPGHEAAARSLPVWSLGFVGFAAVLYGLALIATRPQSTEVLGDLEGTAFLVSGAGHLSSSGLLRRPLRVVNNLSGFASFVFGIVVLAWPNPSSRLLAIFAGCAFSILGLVRLLTTLSDYHRSWWGFGVASGLLQLAGGYLVIGATDLRPAPVALFVGAYLAVTGVDYLTTAVTHRVPPPRSADLTDRDPLLPRDSPPHAPD